MSREKGKTNSGAAPQFLTNKRRHHAKPDGRKKKKAQSYITTHKLERQEGKKRKQTDHAYTRAHIQTDIKGTKPI